MKFSKPFASFEIISEEKRLESSVREAKGTSLKCLAHFKTADGEQILVKVGLSGVSAEGARKNLETEIPDWDFEKVRSAARAAWNESLSRIRITTSSALPHDGCSHFV
jgi:putative alpha-1,2-mannosidase